MIEKIISPANGRLYTSNQLGPTSVMQLKVRDMYTAACSNYTLSYKINSGPWQTVSSPGNIPANGTTIVNVPGLVLSDTGVYNIVVAIHNLDITDPQAGNDTTSITVVSIPNDTLDLSVPYADGFGYLYEDNLTPFYPNGENPYGNPRINDKLGLRFASPVANATVTVTLTSTAPGRFLSFDGNVNYGNTITVTGNADVVSSNIANIRIIGNLALSGDAQFCYPVINLTQSVSSEYDPTYGNQVANVNIPIALRKLSQDFLYTGNRNYPDRFVYGTMPWTSWNTDYTWEARVFWLGDYGGLYPWTSDRYRCLWDSRPNGFALYALNVSGNSTQNAQGGAGLAYRMIVGVGAATTIFTSNTIPFLNAGHKIVIQRTISTSDIKCYINGSLVAQGTDANQYYGTTFRIGAFYDDSSNVHCWTGYIDEVRISSNIRYSNPTSNIFADGFNMGSRISDIDGNTKMLFGFNGSRYSGTTSTTGWIQAPNRYMREEVAGTYTLLVPPCFG